MGDVPHDLSELNASHNSIGLHSDPLLGTLLHACPMLRELVFRADILRDCVGLYVLHVHLLPRGVTARLHVHALPGALHDPVDPARIRVHADVRVASLSIPLRAQLTSLTFESLVGWIA